MKNFQLKQKYGANFIGTASEQDQTKALQKASILWELLTAEQMKHCNIPPDTPPPKMLSQNHHLFGTIYARLSSFSKDCPLGRPVTFPCYHEATEGEGGKRAGTINKVIRKKAREMDLFEMTKEAQEL